MKVAILYRKDGNERDISVISANEVYKALRKLGYKPVRLAFSENMELDRLKSFDIAFNLVYGQYGEDGILASIMQALKIPFVSPPVSNCLLTFNKLTTKKVLSLFGIRTPRQIQEIPLIFKPVTGGSSERVLLINTKSELNKMQEEIVGNSNNYLLEEFLVGREFCVTAIMRRGQLIQLPIAEIKKDGAIFSREEKYGGLKKYIEIPAKISLDLQNEIEDICQGCFKFLNCGIYVKADVILDSKGKPNVIEVDGIPGFGPNSVLTNAAKFFGISFEKLVEILINETKETFKYSSA